MLSGLARLFSHLLQRTPPEATQRRPDFSLLLPTLQTPGPLRGQKERPGRLCLLLWAALTLPGRPPGERLPREEDAGAGQRSSMLVSTVVSTMPYPWPHIYRLHPQLLPDPDGPTPRRASRGSGSKERWKGQDRAEHVLGNGASDSPDSSTLQEILEATFSWAISF